MRPQGATFWLLDGRTGWRQAHADGLSVGAETGIRLAADPDGPLSLRSAAEDLGGLRLPLGMALDDAGALYLLIRQQARIKRFDPAGQRFVWLPTVGGQGSEARQFQDPANIACAGRNLYVADRGNRRVQVFDRRSLALRHLWGPRDWEPVDVAAGASRAYILDGRHGRVYAHRPGTDTLHLLIDEASAADRWTRIAVDRQEGIYLLNAAAEDGPSLDVYTRHVPCTGIGDEVCECSTEPVWRWNRKVQEVGDVRANFAPRAVRLDHENRFCLPARWTGSARLRRRDLKKAACLATRLRNARDPVSRYLCRRFSSDTRRQLKAYDGRTRPPRALEDALIEELNRQLQGSSLYDEERFAQVELAKETRKLIDSQPRGENLVYLNRLLLEAAFPDEIERGCLIRYGPPAIGMWPTPDAPLAPCPPGSLGGLIFNRQGNPLPDVDLAASPGPALYGKSGTWISEALDSDIYHCQWHRLELDLQALPAGTQVTVSTFSHETEQTSRAIRALSDEQWDTDYVITGQMQPPPDAGSAAASGERHEFLVQSRQGRYLWIRLALKGDGYGTPVVSAVRAHYPRTTYLEHLPAVFSADDESRWFLERFLSIFQTEWDDVERRIEEISRYFDPRTVPAGDALEYLARWLALPLEGDWTPEQKRHLLAAAPRIYPRRGTIDGLRDYVRVYLQNITGLDPAAAESLAYPQIVEGFRERQRMMLSIDDLADLGHGAPIWGPSQVGRLQLDVFSRVGEVHLVSTGDPERDLFHEYAHRFRVFVPAAWVRTAKDERLLRRALDAEKPAHSRYDLCLVEPRFRVGIQSTIGLDTIIGAYPAARLACLHETDAPPSRSPRHRLGYDTILAGKPAADTGVRLTPGTRVGMDTILS